MKESDERNNCATIQIRIVQIWSCQQLWPFILPSLIFSNQTKLLMPWLGLESRTPIFEGILHLDYKSLEYIRATENSQFGSRFGLNDIL